jgi:hypothetical protein
VPGLAVARLLEAPPGEPPLLVLGPVEDAFLPIDPVPI